MDTLVQADWLHYKKRGGKFGQKEKIIIQEQRQKLELAHRSHRILGLTGVAGSKGGLFTEIFGKIIANTLISDLQI